MKRVLIGLGILALVPIVYGAFNIKTIFVGEGERAPLWCGAVLEKGVYGISTTEGPIEKTNPLEPLNGNFIRKNEDLIANQVMGDLQNNPFAGLGELLVEKFIDSYAEGFDNAISDGCQGDTKALLRFQERVEGAMQELNSP